MAAVTITMEVPDDLAERVLTVGRVEWGHSGAGTDLAHVLSFAQMLEEARKNFGDGDRRLDMQDVSYTDPERGNLAIALTGTTPHSGRHAQIITGLWNGLHDELKKGRQ